jgi:FKBP-type peptidyl-prolyl cis-trans isomerase
MKFNIGLYFFVFSILLASCRRPIPKETQTKEWSAAHSVDFNQELSIREELKINTFLAHYRELKMQETPSGLRYMIYQKSSSKEPLAQEGQKAAIQVIVKTLDQKICYQTPPDEIEWISIAHSEKETGIHEALLLMRKGDAAKLLLPSYLGHGLLGDRNTIPPQSILYIDLKLIELQ